MFEHCWLIVLRGRMLRRLRPALHASQILSHRLLRYASRAPAPRAARDLARARHARLDLRRRARGASSRCCSRPLAGVAIARYYVLITWATVVALVELPASRGAGDLEASPRGRGEPGASTSPSPEPALVAREPGARGRRRSRSSSTAARCSTGRCASARTARDFELLKLRTMVVGAETMGAGLAVNRGDARITRVGRVLRRLSIDELPQLWNVVRGEMSIDRAAADAPLPGRALRRAPAPPARREARASPAGRRSTAARSCPGPSGSSSTSGTSSTARRPSTCGSCCGRRSRSSAAPTRARRGGWTPAD